MEDMGLEEELENLKQAKKKRELLSGCKVSLRLSELRLGLFVAKQQTVKDDKIVANVEYLLQRLTVVGKVTDGFVDLDLNLKDMQVLQLERRDMAQGAMLRGGRESAQMRGDHSVSDFSAFNSGPSESRQARTTFEMGTGDVSSIWGKGQQRDSHSSTTAQKPPSRLTDMLYSGFRPQSRGHSRAFDYFGTDIPHPEKDSLDTSNIQSLLGSQPRQSKLPRNTSANESSFFGSPKRTVRPTQAQKFHSPQKIETTSICNNPILSARSSTFTDDKLGKVDKRCVFALCGKSESETGISLILNANLLDDPNIRKHIGVKFQLDHLQIEYCNAIFKGLTNLALQFKHAFRFSSLRAAPSKNKLQRKLELQAPLFAVKETVIKTGREATEAAVTAY